jgi:hypothetical protein
MVRSASLFYLSMKMLASIFALHPSVSEAATISSANCRNKNRNHHRRLLLSRFTSSSSSNNSNNNIKNQNEQRLFVSFGKWSTGDQCWHNDLVQHERYVDIGDSCSNQITSCNDDSTTLLTSDDREFGSIESSPSITTISRLKSKRNGIHDHVLLELLKERLCNVSEEVTKRGQRIRSKLRLSSRFGNDHLPSSTTSHDQTSNAAYIDRFDNTNENDDVDRKRIIKSLAQPLMEQDTWEKIDGTEFQRYTELWTDLAVMGETIATQDESNEWIDWNVFSASNNNKPLKTNDDGGVVHVWTGKSQKPNARGSTVPWIKTRSIIPYKPVEMVELLLDSERVQSYNKFSLGRRDCWVASTITTMNSPTSEDDTSMKTPFSYTKIVQNRVQPPLGSKPMLSTTFMHAQPASSNNDNDITWIVVSRAVGGNVFRDPDEPDIGQSEMLLGVNLVQPCSDDENKCILTAVTHVYSPLVPSMLAERVGVKSAIKFVKDIRALKGKDDESHVDVTSPPITAVTSNVINQQQRRQVMERGSHIAYSSIKSSSSQQKESSNVKV